MMNFDEVKREDKELFDAMELELSRQRGNIELIASENFVSEAVLQAMGSHLTNKYAEGYPAKRYYGGCQYVDIVETLAIERAKKLFGADHANVQPHSGANANFAIYFAALGHGAKILGMNLAHGGHLTHGSPVNISGKYFNIVAYGVEKDTETIDYNKVYDLAMKEKPQMIVAGASAYSRQIDFEKFGQIAKASGALLMTDMAHIAGLVATGLHPNPVPHSDFVTSTTHKTLRGPRGGLILCKEEHIKTVNKGIFPGTQGGPLEHVIAGKAVAFKEAMTDDFILYQKQILKNAKAMERVFSERGIQMCSGGTDNHLILIKLNGHNISGAELEKLLDEANITVNKNSIPFDSASPNVTSGIRVGTPAMTTRGFDENEMAEVAQMIVSVIEKKEAALSTVKSRVGEMCANHPLYF